ncbi:MAG TPA: UDP-N-acetylmuramoyl-L-alanine--D-glutamate ligase [Atribacteraceae bacterium]|nr:UDP-N-acetylmuramoyl-L-alanine--D-glutamate ligase [Atribacteraceae bacterium]
MPDYIVIGLGNTGLKVSRFLLDHGERVFAVDDNLAPEAIPAEITSHPGFNFIPNDQWGRLVRHPFHEGIVSPGVPGDHSLVKALQSRGISLISEIELASRVLSFPLIGITGSNGKSTTVSLVGAIFHEAGIPAFVGGNLGTPLLEACLSGTRYEWGVVEVSSFQLERTYTARFHLAAILNVFPNHLDRHRTMINYALTKARILNNQCREDFTLINSSRSSWHTLFCRLSRSRIVPFSTQGRLSEGFFYDGLIIREQWCGHRYSLSTQAWKLPGLHNLENLLCAVATARTAGVDIPSIERALGRFRGLAHRLEPVEEYNGVLFINDSKSTTPAATRAAVESIAGPLVLLVGGRAKLPDFSELSAVLTQDKIKAVILFGESGDLLKEFIPGELLCCQVHDLAEAVQRARLIAGMGDVVLLSPGCASWDQYRNFEDRGEHFRRLIHG